MEFWVTFWKYALIVGVGTFGLMSLWVIVYGFRDIKLMFADLKRQQLGDDQPDQENDT